MELTNAHRIPSYFIDFRKSINWRLSFFQIFAMFAPSFIAIQISSKFGSIGGS